MTLGYDCRALDLVSGMVTKKNLVDIVRILMDHVTSSEGNFRTTLVDKIIEVCMCTCRRRRCESLDAIMTSAVASEFFPCIQPIFAFSG
jgi:hypothetical protein